MKQSFLWTRMSSKRQQRQPRGRIFLPCFFALCLLPRCHSKTIDLSYLPNSDASDIASVLKDAFQDDCDSDLEIDVSFSFLGDSGLKKILESSLPPLDRPVHFVSRANRVTPQGATALVTAFLRNQTTTSQMDPCLLCLDLGWNHLSQNQKGTKEFLSALQRLIAHPTSCPRTLRLDVCGLGPGVCRAIGRGLGKRDAAAAYKPLSLHLSGNEDLGDAGVSALASALRSLGKNRGDVVFDKLDLSACSIGDSGAEDLAQALGDRPGWIRSLDLSNNKITDAGAAAIGEALQMSNGLEALDLSNNKGIGDKGAVAIAAAVEKGNLCNLAIRSCALQADGAMAFGRAIKQLGLKDTPAEVAIDLSGNPLGVLRGKAKSDGKYSASRLKSQASATTANYMNFIGKKIQSGLKDVGVDLSPIVGSASVESDDDAEADMEGDQDDANLDPSKARCGVTAFANVLIDNDNDNETVSLRTEKLECRLGMRHCFLDHAAADALAEAIVCSRGKAINLTIDTVLNPVLEEEMTGALLGDADHESVLLDMAERHSHILEILRVSRERAKQASEAAAARLRAEALQESAWDAPQGLGTESDQWDSDDDYDDEY